MKIAIISVSKKGFTLASVLKKKLDKDSTVIKCDIYHKNVKENFQKTFFSYDAIIAVMASGILIRSISPLIKSKTTDPAVLNIDDNGKFVISTLSGHLGGANKLTHKISMLIDAVPVITTSTDINNKIGIDVIANDLFLSIDNKKEILHFNKAILDNKKLNLTVNPKYNYDFLINYFKNNTHETNISINYSLELSENMIHASINNHEMILKKRNIVAGIGCRRNKSCEDIYKAFKKSISKLNIDISRVDMIASAEIKNDEEGILNLSKYLNIPVYFVDMDKLKLFTSNDISKSDFVKSKFGIYGVCEPAALITAGFNSKLIFKKTKYDGVTIAIALSE